MSRRALQSAHHWARAAITIGCVLASSAIAATFPTGERDIVLLSQAGEEHVIGTATFTPASEKDGHYRYVLAMDYETFKDFFLSMKEMKCLESAKELMCHLAYPYENPRLVSAEDFGWMALDLLFMFKQPSEFGAKLWNGVYFDMALKDGVIAGAAQAVDLNLLAAPPEDPTAHPLPPIERYEMDPTERWLPIIEIR
ncbi:MAG: hypothetical protein AAF184_17670 [Pseudomonadota bacterium]